MGRWIGYYNCRRRSKLWRLVGSKSFSLSSHTHANNTIHAILAQYFIDLNHHVFQKDICHIVFGDNFPIFQLQK